MEMHSSKSFESCNLSALMLIDLEAAAMLRKTNIEDGCPCSIALSLAEFGGEAP